VTAARCRRRTRRHGQAGFVLLEAVVGIAVLSICIAGLTYGFAAMERSASISTDQAQLQTAMRQLSDYVRSRDSVPYVVCAVPTDYKTWITAHPVSAFPSGDAWNVVSVWHSTAATRTVGGTASLPAALQTCASGSDWGVQEIQLTVSSASRSLTRVIWKGAA
jgi:type II secretory pathway pseudopilin PulG